MLRHRFVARPQSQRSVFVAASVLVYLLSCRYLLFRSSIEHQINIGNFPPRPHRELPLFSNRSKRPDSDAATLGSNLLCIVIVVVFITTTADAASTPAAAVDSKYPARQQSPASTDELPLRRLMDLLLRRVLACCSLESSVASPQHSQRRS